MVGAVREGVFGRRATRQRRGQQPDAQYREQFCFLSQRSEFLVKCE
jgi:hypothetical protein